MTEREKLMYSVITQLASTDVPLIFKGGMVTNLVLDENSYVGVRRATVDIDANWTDTPPTMQYLTGVLTRALSGINPDYLIIPFREYGDNRSAGFNVFEKAAQAKVFSMDIEIKPVTGSRTYHYGEMSFQGVLPAEILADKIVSVSGDLVYKHRAKDVIDTFALSHCILVNTREIYYACHSRGKEIKDFNGFLTKLPEMEHAYNKLGRIDNKPHFSAVHEYLSDFLEPFISKDFSEQVWDANRRSWSVPHTR